MFLPSIMAEPRCSAHTSLQETLLQQNTCRCNCTFVDIGLNNGDSLLSWWKLAVTNTKLVQSHRAQRLRACAAQPTTTHCFIGFEANPRWSRHLQAYEQKLQSQGIRVKLFTETAFSIEDGEETFYIENVKGSTGVDASLEGNKAEHYQDRSGWHRSKTALQNSTAFKAIHVRTVDAATFLAQVVAASDTVGVKIDIEGSEYRVLRHMLLTQPHALCRLSLLAMEWHPQTVAPGVALPAAFEWLLSQKGCDVGVVKQTSRDGWRG